MQAVSRSALLVIGLAFRATPLRATALALLTTASAFSGALTAVATKLVVDAIAAREAGAIPERVAMLAAIAILTSLASLASFVLRQRVVDETQLLIDLRLIELSTGIGGIEHHERPEYIDEMARVRERRGQLAGSIDSMVSAVSVVFQLIGIVGVLASVDPLLLLLPVFGVPSFVLVARGERVFRKAWEANTERIRLAAHLFELSTTATPGKELRVFGLAPILERRHQKVNEDIGRRVHRAGREYAALTVVGWLVFSIGFVGALAFVVSRVLDGRASPGDVALVLSLGSQVNEVVGGLVTQISWAMQSLDVVRRFLWLQDLADAVQVSIDDPAEVPSALVDGIRLEHVSFAYPGTDNEVLHDVDLHIPSGTTVAIVGDNGAGKSTLVKLLCRFYEPTSGSITVDGVDLRRFALEEWRDASAAGFQDFARFELLARETVGVGDLGRIDDEAAVRDALDRASGSDVVERLPDGLETQLGKTFTDGTELSGGQWQKLALGRAMMRTSPLLLLLDEPTAAIDAETEHALFERFTGAARAAAQRTGAITVLVSHRFSTVRMADLIVVVDRGGIVEVGSHDQLMGRGGLYAELYELQASGYR